VRRPGGATIIKIGVVWGRVGMQILLPFVGIICLSERRSVTTDYMAEVQPTGKSNTLIWPLTRLVVSPTVRRRHLEKFDDTEI